MIFRPRFGSRLAWVVAFTGLCSLPALAQNKGDANIVSDAALDKLNLQRYWACSIPVPARQKIARLCRVDENIYLQTDAGQIYCVHADVGVIRWTLPFASPNDTFWPLSHNRDRPTKVKELQLLRDRLQEIDEIRGEVQEGVALHPAVTQRVAAYVDEYMKRETEKVRAMAKERLARPDGRAAVNEANRVKSTLEGLLVEMFNYTEMVTIGTSSEAFNVDMRNGAVRRRVSYGYAATSGAASNGEFFFMGGPDFRFMCFSPATGAPIWEVKSTKSTYATPIYIQDRVYWVDGGGTVMASDVNKKTHTWELQLNGPVIANVAYNSLGMFVGTQANSLYLVRTDVGKVRSQLRVNGAISTAPTVTKDHAFVFVDGVGLHAAKTPELNLEFVRADCKQLLGQFDAKTAYVLNNDGNAEKVTLPGGQTIGKLDLPKGTLSFANTQDARIFVCSPGGRLECYAAEDVPFLKQAQIDAVPNLSVVYTKVVERMQFEVKVSDFIRQITDLLAPEPFLAMPKGREEWVSTDMRNMPASGNIDRAGAGAAPAN